MTELQEVVARFQDWARSHTISADLSEVTVESLGVPHRPTTLPRGLQGVYAFRLESVWLKVGRVGPKSNSRWVSQHYKATRSMSNLAWSLLQYAHLSSFEHPELPQNLRDCLKALRVDDISDWIKQHTERVNFLINGELGLLPLTRLEQIAQLVLKPVFEGRWNRGPVVKKGAVPDGHSI
jgi:hypothetical protein